MNRIAIETILGRILIETDAGAVTRIDFSDEVGPVATRTDPTDPLARKCATQLEDYLAGRRKTFDLPLRPAGTSFQQAVWRALREVPYGKTSTYGAIAAAAGNPSASRAAGGAIGANPIAIVIPCHRIIRSDGALSGFAGGVWRKKILLDLERPGL